MSQLPSRPTSPSIEAQVVRLGLMTPDQVATAMREEAETGRTFDEIVVGHGWVSPDDLARVREPEPATPAPAAVAPPPITAAPPLPIAIELEPEPAPEPEPVAVVTESVSAPAAEPFAIVEAPDFASPATASVFVRLASGERIGAGSFAGEDAAEQRARELMHLLDAGGDWPQLDGRYIRPEAIVSIDVDASV